jgi:hypothetical protein
VQLCRADQQQSTLKPWLSSESIGRASSCQWRACYIGVFEDPLVEPLITAFLHHFLFDRRTDAFAPEV